QRAISHINATESGPPETASTTAGAVFQSANRFFASRAEIAESSSSGMASPGYFTAVLCRYALHCHAPMAAHERLQHFTRFCSRSTAALTPLEARGYFRVTSPKAAQAASFSFRAANDWPSRSKASGAFADLSNLEVTARKASAASRYCWRWKKLSPSQYCESATSGLPGYFCAKLRIVSSASA